MHSLMLSIVLVLFCEVTSVPAPDFEAISLGADSGNYAAVAMADLDGDGHAEILSGRRAGEEGLHLFRFCEGRWSKQIIAEGGEYGGVALADITGDKVADVIAVKTSGNPAGLALYRTSVTSGKLVFESIPSPYTKKSCDDLAVGDIEGDGDVDIAVSTGGDGLQVLVNGGKGASFRVLTLKTGQYEDTGIGMGDVNGDGRLDVVAGNHPGHNPRLFLCTESGEVAYDAGHTAGLDIQKKICFEIITCDVNGDKKNDLLIGTQGGLRIFTGNGCTGPESTWWQAATLPNQWQQAIQVAAADLNRDGRPDLAFAGDAGIWLFLNAGAGRFPERLAAGLPTRGSFSGCCLHDWDGDGDLDLACASFQGRGIYLYKNRAIK